MAKGFLERIADIGVAGTALTNTVTATSIMADGERPTLAAKYFERIGKSLLAKFSGRISTVVTTPGTLTLELMFGSIVVATSGAMPLNVVAKTNVHWAMEMEVFSRAIGSVAVGKLIQGRSWFCSEAYVGSPLPSAGGSGTVLLPYNTAPAVGTGFDSQAAQLIDLRATWSIANAANSVQLETAAVDIWS